MRMVGSAFAAMAICAAWALPAAADEGVAAPPEGFTALFNGEDFTGLHGMGHFSPYALAEMSDEERAAKRAADMEAFKQHWKVEDGVLVNDGHGPYATTDKSYKNFEFWIDYNMVPRGDSGIYLRATPQVQIWDTTEEAGNWKHGGKDGSGGLWNNQKEGKLPLVHADKPFGEWNRFHITMVGPYVTVYFNGKLVVDHAPLENFWKRDQPVLEEGPIQLQTHGGAISWRNIFLREIGDDEAAQIIEARNKQKAAGETPKEESTDYPK